ncbi:hypothetical protein [Rhodoferax sp.]|nr:hypothetical protein [Rhodoferax sp.]
MEMKTFAVVVDGGSFVQAADALDCSRRTGQLRSECTINPAAG